MKDPWGDRSVLYLDVMKDTCTYARDKFANH